MATFVWQLPQVGWVIQWRCSAATFPWHVGGEWHTSAIFASPMDALWWFRDVGLGDDPLVEQIRLLAVLHG
jgi:hypothetical protein